MGNEGTAGECECDGGTLRGETSEAAAEVGREEDERAAELSERLEPGCVELYDELCDVCEGAGVGSC